MVAKYGMSDRIGTVNYSDSDEVFLGKDFTSRKNFSEATAAVIDEEVKRLIDDAYHKAEQLLKENMDKLTLIAETLLDIETLNAEQFEQLYTGEKSREQIVSEARAAAGEKAERIAKQRETAEREEKEEREKQEAEAQRQKELLKRIGSLKPEDIVFEHRNGADDKHDKSGKSDSSENKRSQ